MHVATISCSNKSAPLIRHASICTEDARFEELVGQLRKELGYWESYLTSSEHAAGDDYTLADVAAGPMSCGHMNRNTFRAAMFVLIVQK